VSLILILSTKFIDGNFDVLKTILKNTMLIGLLVVTISKEKIEDEFIENLRSKSFSLAFILGVVYVLVQPLINYVVAMLVEPKKASFENLGDFQILWFLLIVYLTAFWSLKRKNA
jgi:L-asparagine transporter-like permease